MSNSPFKSAIVELKKSYSSKSAYKALITIRNSIDWPQNKVNVLILRDSGCLKQLTAVLLHARHKHFVNLALSILGICLMDRNCTIEVTTQHNILSILNQLLKKYPKEDSINGRTFRLISNICQHRDQWATVIVDKKPAIISHIVDRILHASRDELPADLKITEATITTALRALRELRNSQTIITLVKDFKALKAIGALFIKYCEKWEETKENKDMLLTIVKVIHEYSRFRYYHSILELRNTERGDALLRLSTILVLAPRQIVKIVMNFLNSSKLKSELPVPEIFAQFIEALEHYSIIKEFGDHSLEYLKCLCYLLDNPVINQDETRCGKVVPLLIKFLKEADQFSDNVVNCCILVLHALNKFKYFKKLLYQQLVLGIVKILLDKIKWSVGAPDDISLKHSNENKRKFIFVSPIPSKKKTTGEMPRIGTCSSPNNSSDDELVYTKYVKSSRSPSPCSSSDGENSIGALSWSEQTLIKPNDYDGSDSDDYSPVCSDAEDFIENEPKTGRNISNSPNNEELLKNLEDDLSNHAVDKASKDVLMQEIVKLIKTYTIVFPECPQLGNADLLIQLIKWAINHSSNSDHFSITNLICDIVRRREHLITLMQSRLVLILSEMRTLSSLHDSCSKCLSYAHVAYTVLKIFNQTAESRVGTGDIAHRLLTGNVECKKKLILVIPYIIWDRIILNTFMLKCSGLDILMNLLREEDNYSDNVDSIKVLVQMATHCLQIDNPKKIQNLQIPKILQVDDDNNGLMRQFKNPVLFEFEDGAILKADRDFLARKSDYFQSLLNGHFKESNQTQIMLTKVATKSFRSMLYLLENIDQNNRILREIDLDLETLLDVICLCDRYLLVELCVKLADSIQQYSITLENVPIIYNWSIESGTNILRVECMAYALVAKVDDTARLTMFKQLLELGYRKQLVEDIEMILKRYLGLNGPKNNKHGNKFVDLSSRSSREAKPKLFLDNL